MSDDTEEWKNRLILWVISRMPPKEMETAVHMIRAGLDAARHEGLSDAAWIARRVMAACPDQASKRTLKIVADSFDQLIALDNATDPLYQTSPLPPT